jgi:uncharacterized protein
MNLAASTLGNDLSELNLESRASELQELSEAGGTGKVEVRLQISPLSGDAYLARGCASGALNLDCGRCLDKLELLFEVRFNLMISRRREKGLEWLEDEDQGAEDYQVKIGPDVLDIPLGHIIAEQVILNYNLHPLPDLDAKNCCVQCGRPALMAGEMKKADRVDPRWAGLSALKEFSGKKSTKVAASRKKRGKA